MKAFIRARIAAGDTKSEIKAQLVDQFGPAVLAVPPRKGFDLVAWLLPLAGLRSRRSSPSAPSPGAGAASAEARRRKTAKPSRSIPRSSSALDDELATLRMSGTSVAVAFGAGFVSFLAPCVLPLVPGYLSAVSSVEADRLGEPGASRRVVLASLPFVAGLVTVFVLLGAGAAAVGLSFTGNQLLLEQVAGFVLIVFGLVFMGLLPWPQRLIGAGLVQGARRRGSGFLLGGAFAVCAAPCIGPVLGSILVLAGDSDTVLDGSILLARLRARPRGPVPDRRRRCSRRRWAFFRRVRDHYAVIQFVSGVILVALGALLFFGEFWRLRVYLNRLFEALGLM